jgi:murein DD-endopeptidase MepM/ murein hydrolase activator NlpD
MGRLSALAFHDYNGNGSQDGAEPPVAGIVIAIGDLQCTTGDDGRCNLEQLPLGKYSLALKDPSGMFRYILPSVREVRSIGDGLTVNVGRNTEALIPLGHGFLTLPFGSGVPIVVDPNEGDFFDHDPGPDALWWNGVRLGPPRPHTPPNVHPETDFKMLVGLPIYAAAPGRIHSSNTGGELNFVGIDFLNGFAATYLHVERSLVKPGQIVGRGQQIAVSGSSGTPYPHTAFQFYRWDGSKGLCIDPYVPNDNAMSWIQSTNNNGVWVSGTWEWKVYPFETKWPLIGYWTKTNDPQYP